MSSEGAKLTAIDKAVIPQSGPSETLADKAENSVSLFPEIQTFVIAQRPFTKEDIKTKISPSKEDIELIRRVFQDAYKVTRFHGLPKVPLDTTQKTRLITILLEYYERLRREIIEKFKGSGDSVILREALKHIQGIKQLISHFETSKERFPYHKFQNYIDNQEYIDTRDDVELALSQIEKVQADDNKIRNLLRLFVKEYLAKPDNKNYILKLPGISSNEIFEKYDLYSLGELSPTLGKLILLLLGSDEYISSNDDKISESKDESKDKSEDATVIIKQIKTLLEETTDNGRELYKIPLDFINESLRDSSTQSGGGPNSEKPLSYENKVILRLFYYFINNYYEFTKELSNNLEIKYNKGDTHEIRENKILGKIFRANDFIKIMDKIAKVLKIKIDTSSDQYDYIDFIYNDIESTSKFIRDLADKLNVEYRDNELSDSIREKIMTRVSAELKTSDILDNFTKDLAKELNVSKGPDEIIISFKEKLLETLIEKLDELENLRIGKERVLEKLGIKINNDDDYEKTQTKIEKYIDFIFKREGPIRLEDEIDNENNNSNNGNANGNANGNGYPEVTNQLITGFQTVESDDDFILEGTQTITNIDKLVDELEDKLEDELVDQQISSIFSGGDPSDDQLPINTNNTKLISFLTPIVNGVLKEDNSNNRYAQVLDTSTESNNCLIHAFLTATSKSFRILEREKKDKVAAIYRSRILSKLFFYDITEPTADAKTTEAFHQTKLNVVNTIGTFLDDSHVQAISLHHNINIIIISFVNVVQYFGPAIYNKPTFFIKDDTNLSATIEKKAPFIMMFNKSNVHFETIRVVHNQVYEYLFTYKNGRRIAISIEGHYRITDNDKYQSIARFPQDPPQSGGAKDDLLYNYSLKVANNSINLPLIKNKHIVELLEAFDKNSIQHTNEQYLFEKFLVKNLQLFDSTSGQEFYKLVVPLIPKDSYEFAEHCSQLYTLCSKLRKEKDIDVVRLSSSKYNTLVDQLQNFSVDLYTLAQKIFPTHNTVSIIFKDDSVYLHPTTDSYVDTYVYKDGKFIKEDYMFNVELYPLNDSILYLLFVIASYKSFEDQFSTQELNECKKKLKKYSRKQKFKLHKSVKCLLEARKNLIK